MSENEGMNNRQMGTVLIWREKYGFIKPDSNVNDIRENNYYFPLEQVQEGYLPKPGDKITFKPNGEKYGRKQASYVRPI